MTRFTISPSRAGISRCGYALRSAASCAYRLTAHKLLVRRRRLLPAIYRPHNALPPGKMNMARATTISAIGHFLDAAPMQARVRRDDHLIFPDEAPFSLRPRWFR